MRKEIENGLEYDVYEFRMGSEYWYLNGWLHRENGPAIIFYDGKKQYWLKAIRYENIESDEEWFLFQIIT
jgi:hypothetical protein